MNWAEVVRKHLHHEVVRAKASEDNVMTKHARSMITHIYEEVLKPGYAGPSLEPRKTAKGDTSKRRTGPRKASKGKADHPTPVPIDLEESEESSEAGVKAYRRKRRKTASTESQEPADPKPRPEDALTMQLHWETVSGLRDEVRSLRDEVRALWAVARDRDAAISKLKKELEQEATRCSLATTKVVAK